jgi:hypothetical protein
MISPIVAHHMIIMIMSVAILICEHKVNAIQVGICCLIYDINKVRLEESKPIFG